MNLIIIFMIFCFAVFVLIWPLQLAAKLVEARNTGLGSCLFALIAANILSSVVFFVLPILLFKAVIVDIIITALVFTGVLGTSFIRAVAITLLYGILLVALVFVVVLVASVFGVVLTLPFA